MQPQNPQPMPRFRGAPGIVVPQRHRKNDPILSRLRLSDCDVSDSPTQTPPARQILLEAVLLGNLPGYASPWITQYAHELSRSHEGVGLIRFDEKQVRLECFRSADDNDSPPASARPHETFTQAIERLTPQVDIWLIVIDPWNSPAARRRLAEVDRWTLLSGADEAAVVAAYRAIKQLLEGPAALMPQNGLRLMFMGCDREQAMAAMGRIDRATSAFLKMPVELAGVRRQIQPLHRLRCLQFDLAPEDDAFSMLVQMLHDMAEGRAGTAASPVQALLDEQPEAALQPAIEPEPTLTDYPLPPEKIAAPAAQPVIPPPPAAKGLADYLPQVAALEARCPRHPRVEMAVDADGRCHLMLRTLDEPADLAIRQLMETRLWAHEHRQLLALTARDRRFGQSAPRMHLFTAEPKFAVDFAAAAPPDQRDFKLHLLKAVTVGQASVDVHVELT